MKPLIDPSVPRVIRSAEVTGEQIKTPGFQRTIKKLIDTPHSTVHIGVFEPGQAGSMHVHRRSEEVTYVIEGHAEVTVGEERLSVGAGDLFYGPPNVPHQFRNVGDGRLVLVAIYSPPDDLPLVSNLGQDSVVDRRSGESV
ncbi:MAG TPA: cupin domain-containing protein [Chloroflexota bacterium]|nr:cupin domain-containing protein [Chloroflexota bacterium]